MLWNQMEQEAVEIGWDFALDPLSAVLLLAPTSRSCFASEGTARPRAHRYFTGARILAAALVAGASVQATWILRSTPSVPPGPESGRPRSTYDQATFVSGTVLSVDGGIVIGP